MAADVERCVGRFHGVNIKLVKCGGLTPARRMLLLLALLFLSFGSTSFTVGHDTQISLQLPSVGVALLLLILMLELKDKLLSHEEMQAGRVVQRALMPERDPELSGWNGLGLVVQAYQKRGPAMIDWLIDSELGHWQSVVNHVNRRAASHADRMVGDVGGRFEADRAHLLGTVGQAARDGLASYDRASEAQRMVIARDLLKEE